MDIDVLSLCSFLLPLISALISGLLLRKINPTISQILTSSAVSISAIFSWIIFYYVCWDNIVIKITLASWINSGSLRADWAIYIDSLTAVMFVVVNTVSALVHIYSIGYMSHDPHKQRFMSYLSLFTFFMLLLVSADNFIQLFAGWEGVGLSSYLLIGFWFKKKSASNAAMKAFLVNRVGDIGLALGIFLIAIYFGTLEYKNVFSDVSKYSDQSILIFGKEINIISLICLCLFIGCIGKSAQLGLHVWLPDAMEGPTPVSALIHAATMVTAGIFLLARCSYLFEYSGAVLDIVTIIGGMTCLFAATIAIAQNDIKKIIAYSTCSQLGYMVFACGVSAYNAGIFHLITHAFFKALLFLGAGNIIHSISGEQDIRKMGGLYKKLPKTYAAILIGSIALAGIPPLAGFFSKDFILEAAYASETLSGKTAYWLGITAVFLTSLYSCRLIFLVFHRETNLSKSTMDKIHESPSIMMPPLYFLIIGASVSGYAGIHLLNITDLSFWKNSIFIASQHTAISNIHSIDKWVGALPLFVTISSIGFSYYIYLLKPNIAIYIREKLNIFARVLEKKWYFDEIYNAIFVNGMRMMSKFLWQTVDNNLIDAVVVSASKMTMSFSKITSYLQTGRIYHYVISMIVGIMVLIYWYLPN